MNNKNTYIDFSRDLRELYCKINDHRIEGCYLKIASLYNKVFSDWIVSGVKQESIKNQKVYEAIKLLAKIRQEVPYGGKLDSSYVVKNIAFENSTLVPVLWSFFNILNDVRVSSILAPFKDLIITINKILPQKKEEVDQKIIEGEMASSIDGIIDLYNIFENSKIEVYPSKTKKNTLIQKRTAMFLYLLNRFSNDISSACEIAGLHDLAAEFKKNILAKPIHAGIGRFIEISPLPPSNYSAARKMVDYCMGHSDIGLGDYNHDYIELHFLYYIGSISQEEFGDIYRRHQEERDPIESIYSGSDNKISGIDSGGKITYNIRLDPNYLSMLSVFFVEFQSKLKLPV
jgi:hypothetical protein